MVNIDFRNAKLLDFENIKDMFQKAIKRMNEIGIDQWDELYPNEDVIKYDIEKKQMYVGYMNKILVSAAVLNQQQEPEYKGIEWKYNEGEICVIHRLCVHPYTQGQGIGKSTILFIEKTALTLRYDYIRLDVFSNNPFALSLYNSLGYEYSGDVIFRKGKFHCFEKALSERKPD